MTRKPRKAPITAPKLPDADIAVVIGRIKERVKTFDLPPPGFDPLSASPKQLSDLGFPQRPDPVRLPVFHAFWHKMFSPPLHIEQFDLLAADLEGLLGQLIDGRLAMLDASARRQSSLNWSGAYITPRDGTIFSSIHGAWQVPTPEQPTPAAAGIPYRSSTWIGLDGQRRYYQSSLPQIGTSQDIENTSDGLEDQYRAWWQWWARDNPNTTAPLPLPFPVIRHGDFIMASVYAEPDRKAAKFVIKNVSNGQLVRFDAIAPVSVLGLPPLQISGATAEWVMERPSEGADIQILPDYGTTVFSDCLAVAADQHGGPDVERRVEAAKLIDMYEVRHNPDRTAKISIVTPVTESEFITVYR